MTQTVSRPGSGLLLFDANLLHFAAHCAVSTAMTDPAPCRQTGAGWGMIPTSNNVHKRTEGESMKRLSAIPAIALLFAGITAIAQDEAIDVEGPPPQLTGLQAEAAQMVGDKQKLTQEIVDSLFSFSEGIRKSAIPH
jgi:hypothetical protein